MPPPHAGIYDHTNKFYMYRTIKIIHNKYKNLASATRYALSISVRSQENVNLV